MENERITRRGSLARLAGLVVTAAGAESLLPAAAPGSGPAGVASGAVSCVLAPELTEGPFYVDGERVRRTISEGRTGMPLTLRLTVVDASTCRAIKGAAVDVWHCDALGVYSGVAAQGTVGKTFMRGVQRTDSRGLALFQTIYPGWYPGRTLHVHVKVHVVGNVVHTGQLFFSDATTDAVYARAPYRSRGGRDMRNADDSIFVNGGRRSLLALRRSGNAYAGAITMGVHRV